MLKGLSQRVSRKRLNNKHLSSFNDLVALRNVPSRSGGFNHSSTACISPINDEDLGPQDVSLSAAGFNAHDPQADQHVLQATRAHIFSAVFTQTKPARGSLYLRQHLYNELLAQMSKHKGNLSASLHAAIEILDGDYKSLNPSSSNILEGVEIAVAFLDFKTANLHVFSNGSCRCVVGKRTKVGNSMQLVADVSVRHVKEPKEIAPISEMRTIHISKGAADTIILGSTGFWEEVEPSNALLRAQCFQQIAPAANGSACAAHLVNYGLHCVTDRLKGSPDLRMSSLKSVNNLVSLQTGDKSQYKWGSRQPVRRRRGDVHRDLTVVAINLHWEGRQGSFEGDSKKTRQSLTAVGQSQLARHSHWNLVRLHFKEFPDRLQRMQEMQFHEISMGSRQ